MEKQTKTILMILEEICEISNKNVFLEVLCELLKELNVKEIPTKALRRLVNATKFEHGTAFKIVRLVGEDEILEMTDVIKDFHKNVLKELLLREMKSL